MTLANLKLSLVMMEDVLHAYLPGDVSREMD